ncbi:MAG TPA: hypothetical protein PLM71_09370 [Syntrophorhabdaceae bacterium]|nr:hypothetical protein [Syntrophorhabdaceae bacterium]
MNEGAVGQALSEAMQAKYGELNRWQALDDKMAGLGMSIERNLPEISRNLVIVRAFDPDFNNPYVALGRTFEGHLNMAKNKKKELLDMAKGENEKLNKINKMISNVDKELLNAAKGLIGATLEGFLPDEISLVGEASVIVLGAYFGPPGIVAAGIAWGAAGTFNAMINLYYNTKGAADQTKVLSEMKQGLLKQKSNLEKNIETLMSGAREMEEIEKILEKHEKKMNEYKEKIKAAINGWNEQSKAAFENKKKKIEEEIKKSLSEKKYGSEVGLCNGNKVTLSPSAYEGEVNSMVSQLESYTRSVEDGGDPDNFYSFIVDWHNKMSDEYKKRYDDYKNKLDSYNNTSYSCSRSAGEWWDEGWWKRYCSCVISSQTTYANSYIELTKTTSIYYNVSKVFYYFEDRVKNAIRARTKEFFNAWGLWETKFRDANTKVYNVIDDVPYYVEHWKQRSEKLDDEIKHALDWGGNIVDIRNGLLATAQQLKDIDKKVKEASKRYDEINTERMLISNQAQSELTSMLNKWGRLIGYYCNLNLPWLGERAEFVSYAKDVEKGIAHYSERIKNEFKVIEPEHLVKARKTDFISIASIYENKAKELEFYVDWINTYRHRLAGAVDILNRISHETTKESFYATRDKDKLKNELAGPPWSSIAQEIDKFISKEDFSQLPWARFNPYEELNLWQKIYAAQQILISKLEKNARYYIQIRSSGGFQPVSDQIIRPLEDNWKRLRQLCERYDNLAKPEREALMKTPEEISKAAQPVIETYSKMPSLSKDIIACEHYRFSQAYSWLGTYIGNKLEALKPALLPPTNSVAVQLDNLLLNYSALYDKWKKDQEEAQRRMEEERRKFEEEQKRREEEEKRQAERSIDSIKALYTNFKNAYESKNDALVVSFLSKNWQATDGTTISDIQKNLRNTFRVFDEVRWVIQNLNIQPQGSNIYQVTYDLTITGRIYKRNLKHEEKSTVTERVILDNKGKAYIDSTLGGRFWIVN